MPKRESCGSAPRCGLPLFDPLLGSGACRHACRLEVPSCLPSRAAPTCNPHSACCQPVPNRPRLRALALFGRRPLQRVVSLVIPATKNLHNNGLMHRSKLAALYCTPETAILCLPPSPAHGVCIRDWPAFLWSAGLTLTRTLHLGPAENVLAWVKYRHRETCLRAPAQGRRPCPSFFTALDVFARPPALPSDASAPPGRLPAV
jgi:hypothetical protein